MKSVRLILPLVVLLGCLGFVFTGCGSISGGKMFRIKEVTDLSRRLKAERRISWLHCQVSGRSDGACALDNITQAASGQAVRRSCYGNAPGGFVRLDHRMLRAIRDLAKRGYRFRVTALAGASHSRLSRHYAGLAFDVDRINGVRVNARHPDWRKFLARCRELGATETLGPGDPGHATHLHIAWPRQAD